MASSLFFSTTLRTPSIRHHFLTLEPLPVTTPPPSPVGLSTPHPCLGHPAKTTCSDRQTPWPSPPPPCPTIATCAPGASTSPTANARALPWHPHDSTGLGAPRVRLYIPLASSAQPLPSSTPACMPSVSAPLARTWLSSSAPPADADNTIPDTSHVPCKFFRQGACQAGNACPFSHDLGTSAETVCKYFAKVRETIAPHEGAHKRRLRRRRYESRCTPGLFRIVINGCTLGQWLTPQPGQLQVWPQVCQHPRPPRWPPHQLRQEWRHDRPLSAQPPFRPRRRPSYPPRPHPDVSYALDLDRYPRRPAQPVPRTTPHLVERPHKLAIPR